MTSETTWFIISLCLLQMVCPVLSGFEKVCTFETYRRGVHQQGACGDNLADMLRLVCRKYKRSGGTRPGKTYDVLKRANFTAGGLSPPQIQARSAPWKSVLKRMMVSKEKALAFIANNLDFHRRKKKGSPYNLDKRYGDINIVCECCYHSCSVAEFEDYCAEWKLFCWTCGYAFIFNFPVWKILYKLDYISFSFYFFPNTMMQIDLFESKRLFTL